MKRIEKQFRVQRLSQKQHFIYAQGLDDLKRQLGKNLKADEQIYIMFLPSEFEHINDNEGKDSDLVRSVLGS